MFAEPFFRSLPLVIPGTVVAAFVLAVLAPYASRRFRVGKTTFWLFGTAVAGFLALTLTPTSSVLDGYKAGQTYISLHVTLPTVNQLTSINEVSLNVVAGIAIGVTAFLFSRSSGKNGAIYLAVSLPVVAEIVQWVISQLGRSGFLLTDVVQNWLGIAAGVAAGAAIVALYPRVVQGRRPLKNHRTPVGQ